MSLEESIKYIYLCMGNYFCVSKRRYFNKSPPIRTHTLYKKVLCAALKAQVSLSHPFLWLRGVLPLEMRQL